MCLAVLALNTHPDWPLILVANRDEFHARPTQPLGVWPDLPILGGRDLQAGGSWMGLGDNNRFALVTNHRDLRRPVPEQARSRGHLVNDFLLTSMPAPSIAPALTQPMPVSTCCCMMIEAGTTTAISPASADHCTRASSASATRCWIPPGPKH